jgi:hypothetical protein
MSAFPKPQLNFLISLDDPIGEVQALYETLVALTQTQMSGAIEELNYQGAYLRFFSEEASAFKTDTTNLVDDNRAKDLSFKTEVQELFSALKQLDGITSYMDKFDGTVSDAKNTKGLGKTKDRTKLSGVFKDIKSSKLYKSSLASAKTLSFFVAVLNISDMAKGKEQSSKKYRICTAA